MALTCKTLSTLALAYIDVENLGQASLAQQLTLAGAINGALQELYSKGPAHFRRREISTMLNGATSVQLGLTPNGTAISTFSGWQDWMRGCTVRVDGDVYDNEIVSQTQLLQPWQGATAGTVNAQVFGDAVTLDPGVAGVLGCVRLADIRELCAAPDRESFNRANFWYEGDYGEAILSVQVRRKWTGQPHTYWVDNVSFPAGAGVVQPTVRLRVAPIPQQAYVLKFDALLNPPTVALGDLGSDSCVFELPGASVETLLVPFVLQRWTACPWWKNRDAGAEIARQYEVARVALYGSNPQVKRATRLTPLI